VSTRQPGQPFYALPNFKYFTGPKECTTRPCYLPLYDQPSHQQGVSITLGDAQGWPCEGFLPNVGPACISPPAGRTPGQQWNPYFKWSGDKVLVACQTTGQRLQDDLGAASNIWDGIVVPASKLNGSPQAKRHPIPGLPGYYLAYGPDIWLGHTGWHRLPHCPAIKLPPRNRLYQSAPREGALAIINPFVASHLHLLSAQWYT
jgi:hypothetical protein